jgi:hypothetical protein
MPMPRSALILAVCLALPLPALADAADRRLSALHLVETAADDALIRRLAEAPVQQLLRQTHVARPELSRGEMMVLSALYYDEMHRAALAALRDRAGAIAGRYSLAEIAALREFAATEEGPAVLAAQEGLTGGLAEAIAAEMRARMAAALDRHGRPAP